MTSTTLKPSTASHFTSPYAIAAKHFRSRSIHIAARSG
ncbi:hypothetical protein S40288_11586 [Stachybotrys chartarum IBT 40288]|nr:hypothetical protein S40288_11586 [Stachybotrys chartarum IBT 40288]